MDLIDPAFSSSGWSGRKRFLVGPSCWRQVTCWHAKSCAILVFFFSIWSWFGCWCLEFFVWEVMDRLSTLVGFFGRSASPTKTFLGAAREKRSSVLFTPSSLYLFSHFGNNMLLWNAVCISRPFCCYCTTAFILARFFTPHCVVFLSREFNNLNYINITWIITAFWLFLGNSMWFLFCVFATFHLRSFLHDAKITIILYSRPSLEAKLINI